jgi:hypothetical protein
LNQGIQSQFAIHKDHRDQWRRRRIGAGPWALEGSQRGEESEGSGHSDLLVAFAVRHCGDFVILIPFTINTRNISGLGWHKESRLNKVMGRVENDVEI